MVFMASDPSVSPKKEEPQETEEPLDIETCEKINGEE